MARRWIPVALLLTLSACALPTTQVQPGAATAAPAERVKWRAPGGADSHIKIARDVGMLGGGCYMALFINGQLAARLATGEVADFKVPSGELLLGVGHDPEGRGLCSGVLEKTVINTETQLKPGETKGFRLMAFPGGRLDIRRADL